MVAFDEIWYGGLDPQSRGKTGRIHRKRQPLATIRQFRVFKRFRPFRIDFEKITKCFRNIGEKLTIFSKIDSKWSETRKKTRNRRNRIFASRRCRQPTVDRFPSR